MSASGVTRRCASIPSASTESTSSPAPGRSTPASGRRRSTDRPKLCARRSVRAVDRVRAYHEHQREPGFHLTEGDGSLIGMRVTPLDRVGLYVPGGKASYPSSVIMNAVPAAGGRGAGDHRRRPARRESPTRCSPRARCPGVTRIFRVGGAQAIAALAYGTTTIPRVDKIVGPGNRWVAEAKRQVVGEVGIDMIAGPTEVLIIADATARPARVAADLDRAGGARRGRRLLVRHDRRGAGRRASGGAGEALATAPRAAIAREVARAERAHRAGARMRDAIEVANRRAPEHLEIVAEGAERIAASVRHAGAIFLGDDTPEPVGDYIAGPESRPAHGRHRALRLAARRLRLRQAHQRDPLHAAPGWRRRRGHHRAGRGRRAVGHAEAVGCGWPTRRRDGRTARSGNVDFPHGRPRARPTALHLRRARPPRCRRLWIVLGLTGHVHGASRRWAAGSADRLRCWPMPATCSPMSARSGSRSLTAWIAQRPADDSKTYGYLRWEILAALVNGAALFGIAGWVVVEALQRIQHPEPIRTGLFLAVAAAGLVVNLVSLGLLHGSARAA